MIAPRTLALHLTIALALCTAISAQVAEIVLSVRDGARVWPMARLAGGRWTAEATCGAVRGRAGEERLEASAGLRLIRVRALAPGSPEWLRLTPIIIELFERREREERLLGDRTSRAPRAVDWIYTTEGADLREYYFEASRRVASASADVDHDTDPPGTVRISVAGFLQQAGEAIATLGAKSELRWEQDGLPAGPGRPDLLPLGVVAHDRRVTWVMKGQSGSSIWFTMYDVSRAGIRTLLTMRC